MYVTDVSILLLDTVSAFVMQHLAVCEHVYVCSDRGTQTSLMTIASGHSSPNILQKIHNDCHIHQLFFAKR